MINDIPNNLSLSMHLTLVGLLSRLGHYPVRCSQGEQHYQNVFRKSESRPSLVVNTHLNAWFDQHTKKTGDLIDFALLYWQHLSPEEVMLKIRSLYEVNDRSVSDFRKRKRRAVRIPCYHIESIKPLGSNAEIAAYLKSEDLWELSAGYLKEIYYYVIDEKKKRKDFSAAGWQNENGGWEVRCKNYSGCLGAKGMTFIPGAKNAIVVFHEMKPFLIWNARKRQTDHTVLILNSPDFREAASRRINKFPEVIYPD